MHAHEITRKTARLAGPERGRADRAGREILEMLAAGYEGPVAVRAWNGDLVVGAEDAPCTLSLHNPAVLREMVLRQNLKCLGEAFLTGEIDIEGDIEQVFSLADHLLALELGASTRLNLVRLALQLPRWSGQELLSELRATRKGHNSREAISHHYNLGNAFYRLWLDPQMVYSCGYFRDENATLAEAQTAKLHYICRKLRLQPGEHLLDIGCGWGAMILHAARHYDVRAHGITLSEQQYDWTRERIEQEGLGGRVTVELRDYRDLPEEPRYEKIVSVGMFEHVGVANFPAYFDTVRRLLRPGGAFLNHGITNDTGWPRTPLTEFVNDYVFPDGELTRISTVLTAMEDAGFEILDVESLRRHYAMTLRCWIQNLYQRRSEVVATSSEAIFRLWALYMAGSAFYFDEGSLNVYQVVAAPAKDGRPRALRRAAP